MKSIGMIWVCALAANVAFAQEPPQRPNEDLEVTMRVIVDPNAKFPDAIVRRIPLPPAASPAARPDGTEPPGRDVSAQAREKGREFGQETAARARDMAEQARRNGGPPDGRPGPPVTPPGRPDDLPDPASSSVPTSAPVSPPRPPKGN